jgi:hypothetical protein
MAEQQVGMCTDIIDYILAVQFLKAETSLTEKDQKNAVTTTWSIHVSIIMIIIIITSN